VDILITEREYLLKRKPSSRNVSCLTVRDALALVSLYLRTQNEYLEWRSPDGHGTVRTNKGAFYWVGGRELLPSGWRWFTACVKHSSGTNDDSLTLLGGSLLQRFARALRERDDVHRALNQPQNNDTADDALASLDNCLMLLMGALDVSARVAHYVLGIQGSKHSAGWQREGWLKKVARANVQLASVVQDQNSPGAHVLIILGLLRNTVHGEALTSVAYQRGADQLRTLMALPRDEQTALLTAVRHFSSEQDWGIEPIRPNEFYADPDVLIDQLLPRVADLLNGIMDATPVESLAHASLRPEDLGPPADKHDGLLPGMFSEKQRQSFRWQLGF